MRDRIRVPSFPPVAAIPKGEEAEHFKVFQQLQFGFNLSELIWPSASNIYRFCQSEWSSALRHRSLRVSHISELAAPRQGVNTAGLVYLPCSRECFERAPMIQTLPKENAKLTN